MACIIRTNTTISHTADTHKDTQLGPEKYSFLINSLSIMQVDERRRRGDAIGGRVTSIQAKKSTILRYQARGLHIIEHVIVIVTYKGANKAILRATARSERDVADVILKCCKQRSDLIPSQLLTKIEVPRCAQTFIVLTADIWGRPP